MTPGASISGPDAAVGGTNIAALPGTAVFVSVLVADHPANRNTYHRRVTAPPIRRVMALSAPALRRADPHTKLITRVFVAACEADSERPAGRAASIEEGRHRDRERLRQCVLKRDDRGQMDGRRGPDGTGGTDRDGRDRRGRVECPGTASLAGSAGTGLARLGTLDPDPTRPPRPHLSLLLPNRTGMCAHPRVGGSLIAVSYPRNNHPNLLGRLVTNPRTDDH